MAMTRLDTRLRVVVDTNCLLQMLGATSPYRVLWLALLREEYVLCVSNDVVHEYEEILRQKASPLAARLFMQVLARSANVVSKDPYFRFGLITADPNDNKFVDCAIVHGADFIVTEDHHFQALQSIPFPSVQTQTLDEFVRVIAARQS